MATLYELGGEFLEMQDLLKDPEASKETLKEAMTSKEQEMRLKMQGYLKARQNLLSDLEEIQGEKARLTEREQSMKAELTGIEESLLSAMQILDVKSLNTPLFSVKVRQGTPSVVILDEEEIPAEFLTEKRTVSPDKKKIKKFLEFGGEMEGAVLERKESLKIS